MSQGNGGTKLGRNKRFCEKYLLENRRVKNKIKKLIKHLKTHTKDRCSKSALDKLKEIEKSKKRIKEIEEIKKLDKTKFI